MNVKEFLRKFSNPTRKDIVDVNTKPVTPSKPVRPTGKRDYWAAEQSRNFSDWVTYSSSEDLIAKKDNVVLRNRARDLSRNNDYARRFLNLLAMNVVGHEGFLLQNQAEQYSPKNRKRETDVVANIIIEKAFADWSRSVNCTVDGKLTFRALQQLIMKSAARDGEFFVRMVYNNSKYGLQLQAIGAEMVDEKYHNIRLQNGNVIIMGVEIDQWVKPVAYYVKRIKTEYLVNGIENYTWDHERVPASEMIHGFMQEYAIQTRGVTWLAPVMRSMWWLAGIEDAALMNMRYSSMKGGVITKVNPDATDIQTDDVDEQGNRIIDISAGQLMELDYGQELQEYNPTFPQGEYAVYVKAILRKIASGLNVQYNTFANDLEGVNYSSIRSGTLDEREAWKNLQTWFIESFLNRVFPEWLKSAMLTNNINLPFTKFEQFNAPKWYGRRWQWVAPDKDIIAESTAIDNGLMTITEALAGRGKDFRDTVDRLAEEQQYIKAKGVTLHVLNSKGSPVDAGGNPTHVDNSPSVSADITQDADGDGGVE